MLAAPLLCALLSVTDGDTFRADCGNGSEPIRIADIDAPEMGGDCEAERAGAVAARDALTALLAGRLVEVRPLYPDRYARTVAQVSVGGSDVGAMLIEAGLAKPWPHDMGRALAPRPEWCGQ